MGVVGVVVRAMSEKYRLESVAVVRIELVIGSRCDVGVKVMIVLSSQTKGRAC